MLQHHRPADRPLARVVILGSGGFLSPVLRRTLEGCGAEVAALGRSALDLSAQDAGPRLAALLEPADAVVMAAGLTPDKGKDTATLMANLRMAEAVAVALERVRPAHFVYISSDAVYDARFSSLLNEESTCEPSDLYALMHVAREKILGQCCQQAGIPFVIVRPCAIYGPGDTHNSYGPNRFFRSAASAGKITLFGNGEERRHHIFVGDVAELIRLCLQHGSTGVINAVTGRAVSFAELAESVGRCHSAPITIEKLPRVSPVTHRHFDLSALALALPDFRATSLTDGLDRMRPAEREATDLAALASATPGAPEQEGVCSAA